MDLDPPALDLLLHAFEAEQEWTNSGHDPRSFLLLHLGGMKRSVDHPGWDEAWPVPTHHTVDDLVDVGYLRVEQSNGLNRTFVTSPAGRQRALELLAAPQASPPPTADDRATADSRATAAEGPVPTAFISWAHGDATWEQTVLTFAYALRRFGVEADIDLFHQHDRDVEWSTFGVNAIKQTDFILIAVSRSYRERWEGSNNRTIGAGAAAEADALQGLFARNQADFRARVKIVLLTGAVDQDIPIELLASAQRFEIKSFDLEGLEDLLRVIHNRPALVAPPVGTVPVLPPRLLEAELEGTEDQPAPSLQSRLEQLQAGLATLSSDEADEQRRLVIEHRTIEATMQAIAQESSSSGGDEAPPLSPPSIVSATTLLMRHLQQHGAQTAAQLEQALGDIDQIGVDQIKEWAAWACANGTIERTAGSSAVPRWNITDKGQKLLGPPW